MSPEEFSHASLLPVQGVRGIGLPEVTAHNVWSVKMEYDAFSSIVPPVWIRAHTLWIRRRERTDWDDCDFYVK